MIEVDSERAAIEARLRERHRGLETLIDLGASYLSAGDAPAAAALAQVAARSAFPDHPGLFGSPRLERLLLSVGQDLPSRTSATQHVRRVVGSGRNVLHVLTYARPVGGDGRFVWRWMLADDDSRHSVAVTTQGHYAGVFSVPAYLREAAESSGGQLHEIRASPSNPIDQALELRRLALGRDLVVLHLWPYDTVPVLALAAGCGDTPTVMVNHSDHTFWIGGSVAHSVVHLRSQLPQFLADRRRIDPDRTAILPIPLVPSRRAIGRDEAKRELGLAPETVLLVTVASPFKFSAPGLIGFLDLVVPVLAKMPQARLVAIGPSLEGAWRAAADQTGGRIEALGPRWENSVLLAAADVYLDSVPFSSITSLLEAGCQGLPALGLAPMAPDLSLLGPGAPGLDGAMELASDPDGYRESLTRLIADPDHRDLRGRRLQSQILSGHTGGGWLEFLRRLYDDLDACGPRGCVTTDQDSFDVSPLDIALAQLYEHAHEAHHVPRLIRNYVGALPYGSRLSVSRRLREAGFTVSPLTSLPPPLSGIVRGVGRPVKRVGQRFTAAFGRR
ncbi:MAG TPA: hypothetical protein PKB14_11635 [Rubrivivax sp.]|nr:hypothetical protein [Rubrivivax sp.]